VSNGSYWAGLLEQRASRRSVIVGGAGLAGAAALLAACGGSSSDGGSSGAAGSINIFTDTKAEGPIKTGGIYKKSIGADLTSLDPYKQTTANTNTEIGTYAMSRMLRFKSGPGVDPTNFEPGPDLAESWEVSDGGLTYTFKMRQGVKFHNIAPVSGRILDSEDVTASYKRFSVGLTSGIGGSVQAGSTGSPSFGNSLKGVVASVSAPDKSTVVFKLTKPNAIFLNILATQNFFWIFPKEVDTGYDPLQTTIGTGPWQLTKYLPSSRFEYSRHPDYYEKGVPYMDGAVSYIIGESAQRIAQFQAGSIFQYTPVSFEEFDDLTSGNRSLRILGLGIGAGVQGIGFGRTNPDSPFIKDVRVRRATSVAINRVEELEVLNDYEKYKKVGIVREYRLASFIPPNLSKYWVDPRGKEMGENGQWFEYDPAKAKQLLSAAGYANGFDFPQKFASRDDNQSLNAESLLQEYWAAVGMRSKLTPEDYDSLFNPISWHGESDGLVIHGWQTFGDPAQQLDYLFGPTSTRNQMAVNDPKFNALQDQNMAELDTEKRRAIIIEELKYLQGEMRHTSSTYASIDSYTLAQPQVRNNWAFRSSDSNSPVGTNTMYWWLAS
jgi:peptide/nickel transport system substrate-binding protein